MSDATLKRTRDEQGRFQASTSPDDVYEAMEPLEPTARTRSLTNSDFHTEQHYIILTS